MKTILIAAGLAAALVMPAGAAAKPDHDDKAAAKAECKAERGKTKATRKAFKLKYHSFSRCMKQTAVEEEAEEEAARENAAQECKAERDADSAAFQEKYGTNGNKKNAFGKCVSMKAHEKKAAEDAEDAEEAEEFKNAAKECWTERAADVDAFREKYGTNPNKRNAFGKCVSGKSGGADRTS
jgi:hypothetical protein